MKKLIVRILAYVSYIFLIVVTIIYFLIDFYYVVWEKSGVLGHGAPPKELFSIMLPDYLLNNIPLFLLFFFFFIVGFYKLHKLFRN